MDTFINSKDPDEMTHYAAFHQGLYCLLGKKDLQTKTNTNTTFKNYNLTPQDMYSGLSKFIASNQTERSICIHSKLLEVRSGRLVIY